MQLRAQHFKLPVPEKPLFKMLHGIFLSPATWMQKKPKQTNKQKQKNNKKTLQPNKETYCCRMFLPLKNLCL